MLYLKEMLLCWIVLMAEFVLSTVNIIPFMAVRGMILRGTGRILTGWIAMMMRGKFCSLVKIFS